MKKKFLAIMWLVISLILLPLSSYFIWLSTKHLFDEMYSTYFSLSIFSLWIALAAAIGYVMTLEVE